MAIFQVSKVKAEFPSPPRIANFVNTAVANDLMVLTFAFVDPSQFPTVGPDDVIQLEAKGFEQVALPRSAFAGWLAQVVTLVSGLGDRETLGWNEITKVVTEANAKSAKP